MLKNVKGGDGGGGTVRLGSEMTNILVEAEELEQQRRLKEGGQATSTPAAGDGPSSPPVASGRYFERLHWSRVVQNDPMPDLVLFPPPGQDLRLDPRLPRTHRCPPGALLPVPDPPTTKKIT